MSATIGGVRIVTNGQTLVVDITTSGGARPTVYTAANGDSTHSLPVTISSDTEFHITAPMTLVVSAKRNGVEIAGQTGTTRTLEITQGTLAGFAPTVNAGVEAVAQEATFGHLAGSETFTGKKTFGLLGLGAATTPTIAAGVLTVTSSHVNPLPESSTSDTVDSIVLAGQAAGDLLLCHVPATNTITFDNSATMLLGAATRAVAPGGSILLVAVSATVWHEVSFLAATS